MLKELAPGVHAWEANDQTQFRAFAVSDGSQVVLIDPLLPDGLEQAAIDKLGKVGAVLLTGAWHERDSAKIARQYGIPVYASMRALGELENKDAKAFPDELPMGIEALDAAGGLPGQVCFYLPRDGGSLFPGDAWQNVDFTTKSLPMRLILKYMIKLRHGLNPTPPVKCADLPTFRERLTCMLERPIERVLVAHGDCLLEGAHPRLAARLQEGP